MGEIEMTNDKALASPVTRKTQADHIAMLQLYIKDLKNIKLWKGDSGLVAAIEALSATDAPIVEGLETAILRREKGFYSFAEFAVSENSLGQYQRDNELFYEAAKLYAQGRTQNEVPESNTVDELVMLICRLVHKSRNVTEMADLRAKTPDYLSRKNLTPSPLRDLSAAPPVTGSAWLPIESAPKDGTKIIAALFAPHIELSDPVVVGIPQAERKGWNFCWASRAQWSEEDQYWHDGLDKLAAFNFWQPVQPPPSSAEKEGV